MQLEGLSHLVLVDARVPVAFAYPGLKSELVAKKWKRHVLASGAEDVAGALEALAEAVGAGPGAQGREARTGGVPAGRPTGPLTSQTAAAVLASLLPEGAVVSDESITSTIQFFGATM